MTVGARALAPGTHTLSVEYLGDDNTKSATRGVTLTIAKASSKVSAVSISTSKPKARKTKLVVGVKITSNTGVPATGKVRVKIGSKTYSGTLKNGVAKVKLPKQKSRGTKKVTISYSGSSTVSKSSTVVKRVRWR